MSAQGRTAGILIVDDEAPARLRLRRMLSELAADEPQCANWQVVAEAGNGVEALAAIQTHAPAVVLLDIQMPGESGIAVAARIAALDGAAPAVIFITAFDAHALAAFEVGVLDYLLKPVRASRLQQAIARVLALRGAPATMTVTAAATAATLGARRQHFSVAEKGRVLLVPVAEVLYLKAQQKYITLRTAGRDYLIEESLLSIEEELAATFVRVHRNALVARAAIAGVERSSSGAPGPDGEKGQEVWQVLLRGSEERLPISRRQWAVIKALVR